MRRTASVLLSLSFCWMSVAAQTLQSKQQVDYVSPNIGGIGQLLTATTPYVQRPYGMARLAPITTPGITDRYLADKIYGFPAGPAILMASAGELSTNPADYASDFDHDFEASTPYYYSVDLQTSAIKAEVTATSQAAYYRFTFPATNHAHLVLHMSNHAELSVVDNHAVEGSQRIDRRIPQTGQETREYFYAEFSKPFKLYKTWNGNSLTDTAAQHGDEIGFVTDGLTHAGERIEVRVGLSYISV